MHQLISKKYKILVYLLIFIILSSTNNINFNFFKDNFFTLKKINIEGISDKLRENIQKDLSYLTNNNLLFVDKEKIKNKLSNIDYIDSFNIFKIYPSELKIKITKTEFIANSYFNGQKFLVGKNGKFINAKYHNYKKNLPYAYGNYDAKKLVKLLVAMKELNIDITQVKEFYFFESQRWDFVTYDEILIKLPSSDLKKSLKILKEILTKKVKKKIIDLRVPNQVIISNG